MIYLRNVEFIMTIIEFIMVWIQLIFLENINENWVIRFYTQDREVFAASSAVRSYPATRTLECLWCLANQKKLPPCMKTFVWRLIKRAIGARRYSNKISKQCCTCNDIENDAHLFFHCTFVRAIWFSANPPLCYSTLPQEQDDVQEILPIIIKPTTYRRPHEARNDTGDSTRDDMLMIHN